MQRIRLLFLATTCWCGCATLKPAKVGNIPETVNETSGLVCIDSSLWTMNDSGHTPTLYRLNKNALVADTTFLYQANNEDWEDLAADSLYLYVGDIGNNLQVRRGFFIYTVQQKDLQTESVVGSQTLTIDALPDQPEVFPKVGRRNFDLEALFIKNGYAYIISKNIKATGKSYGKLYRRPNYPGAVDPELIDSFRFNEPITGADYDPTTNTLIVTGYLSMFVFSNFDENNFHNASPRRYRYNKLRQYEGIAFDNDKQKIYLTNEKGFGKKSALFELPLSSLRQKEKNGGIGFVFRRCELSFILWVYNTRLKQLAKQKHLLKPKPQVPLTGPNER